MHFAQQVQLAQAHYGAVELDLAGAFISERKRA